MNRSGLACMLILFWILFLAGAGCDAFGPSAPPPNIVLLSIDTLRTERLGCYGNDLWDRSPSPAVDRLAAEGILFERCFAPRGQTHPSIASMLTGKYPITHTLRENGFILPAEHKTFIQALKDRGYATAGFAANLSAALNPLNPMSSEPNWWARGLEAMGDGFGADYRAATKQSAIENQWSWDERVEQLTLRWINDYDPAAGKPFFLWTHFYDPHKPYLPHESSPDLFPDYLGPLTPQVDFENGKTVDRVTRHIDEATRAGRSLEATDHKKVLALYDASVYGVDERVDRILKALYKKGMLENTWIVFTSDHGDELGDHNDYYYHGASIYDAVLRIPLIVVGPGAVAGRRVKGLTQNVDMAPTILEIADARPLHGMEGVSLTEALLEEEGEIDRDWVVAEWQKWIYAYSDGRYKYIFNPNGALPVKPPYFKSGGHFQYDWEELYHLESDPGEQTNIIEDNREIAASLRKKLIRWLEQEGHDLTMEASRTGEGTNEAVQMLGYTGADQRGPGKKNRGVKFMDLKERKR